MGGPAILFSKRGCPRLIAGDGWRLPLHLHQSGYVTGACLTRIKHSHLPDALQYGVLGFAKTTALQGRARDAATAVQPAARVSAAGWT